MPLHELNGLFMLVFISRTHWDSNTPPPPAMKRMSRANINPRFLRAHPQDRIDTSLNEVPSLVDISLDNLHTI